MYKQRVKVFTIFYALLLLVMVLRLAQMQLLPSPELLEDINDLKRLRGYSQQTKSLRGSILDRHGEILAGEEAVFKLYVNYSLIRYADERVTQAMVARARQLDRRRQQGLRAKAKLDNDLGRSERKIKQQIEEKHDIIQRLLGKCPVLGISAEQARQTIQQTNNWIWNRRLFRAWRINCEKSPFHQENRHRIGSVLFKDAKPDFERMFPDPAERRLLITGDDTITRDLRKPLPLLTLETDDAKLAAQLEFLDVKEIEIRAEAVRRYYFKDAAAHTIGWIGSSRGATDPFAEDKHRRYLHDELVGRDDGIEYACDAVLRGSRGERFRDIDQNLQRRAETEHGRDVRLTLDIKLQQRIEHYLAYDANHAPHCNAGFAAVVLDVNANDILALVSLPTFDPAQVRMEYGDLIKNPLHPLRNRAINEGYPPGSVAKPLVAVAGLESGSIAPHKAIHCPSQAAPPGWPNCWIFKDSHVGHETQWPDNNALNAIKGSCNIYFSRLATRMDPLVLQQWFFRFGYGRKVPFNYPRAPNTAPRRLRQVAGQISSTRPPYGTQVTSLEQIPELRRYELRNAGIGQGNIRVTPLQVANSMATLARNGVFKYPRLFMNDQLSDQRASHSDAGQSLHLSEQTVSIVIDGLYAVVNEENGTAHRAFSEVRQGFRKLGVTVYGKTGSTEDPEHAWFAGYAKDFGERCLALAVLVEGGKSGAEDATPLARDIIQFCIDHQYLGHE